MSKASLFLALFEAHKDSRLFKSDCDVYAFLLDRSRNAKARTSQARIAEAMGMHEASVPRSIRKLETLGYVETKRFGANQTNIYQMLKLTDRPSANAVSKSADRPSTCASATDLAPTLADSKEPRNGGNQKTRSKDLLIPKPTTNGKANILPDAGLIAQQRN